MPITITCNPILRTRIPNKFVKVFIDKDRTEEFNEEQQNAVHDAPPAIKYIEDDHS